MEVMVKVGVKVMLGAGFEVMLKLGFEMMLRVGGGVCGLGDGAVVEGGGGEGGGAIDDEGRVVMVRGVVMLTVVRERLRWRIVRVGGVGCGGRGEGDMVREVLVLAMKGGT